MPVSPAAPFDPRRYVIDGDPTSVHAAHTGWTTCAQDLYRMIAHAGQAITTAQFDGPEAALWRETTGTNLDHLGNLARGIQAAGEALGEWATAIDTATAQMLPVQISAQGAYTALVAAIQRVVAAEAAAVIAAGTVAVAETELAVATAATALTGGTAAPAVAAAQAHLTAAIAELTRATTEVASALSGHHGATTHWNTTNAEADSIQNALAAKAATAAAAINVAAQMHQPNRRPSHTAQSQRRQPTTVRADTTTTTANQASLVVTGAVTAAGGAASVAGTAANLANNTAGGGSSTPADGDSRYGSYAPGTNDSHSDSQTSANTASTNTSMMSGNRGGANRSATTKNAKTKRPRTPTGTDTPGAPGTAT